MPAVAITTSTELYIDAAWQDHTAATQVPEAVKLQRGQADEGGGALRPSKIELTFLSQGNEYDPSVPTSPLYGKAGRNTPTRFKVAGVTQAVGEASAWSPVQTPDFIPGANPRGRRTVGLVAEGVLRRIGQWDEPLRSPLYRRNSLLGNSIGHWPLEDETATQLANTLPGGRPGDVTGVTFRGDDGPAGSDPLVELKADAVLGGAFATTTAAGAAVSTTGGWQVSWVMKLPAIPPPSGYLGLVTWNTSNGLSWTLFVDDNEYRITARRASDGVILLDQAATFGTGASPDQWVQFRVKVSQVGADLQVEPAWYAEGAAATWGFTATFPFTGTGRPTRWAVRANAYTTGGAFGHLFALAGTTDNLLAYAGTRAFDGYAGETAAARFLRLLFENGITRYIWGTAGDTRPMGPQKSNTLMGHLKEIADTDDALIYDERVDNALTIMTRVYRYNRPATLALAATDLAPPVRKRIDDLVTANVVTAKNSGGGEYTAARTSGPTSTLAPPLGAGEYRKTVDVNVADLAALELIAGHYLAKGTNPRPRYSQLAIDLRAKPAFAAQANLIDVGHLVTVTGLEPDLVRLWVVGIDRETTNYADRLTLTTLPAEVWVPNVWDNATARWDSRTSTVGGAGLTTTATALTITFTNPDDAWSTTPGYGLMVGGERMTVTAMGAVAGSGPYTQAATVTRSVNGVVKAQTVTTEVHVFEPLLWTL